ncbi:hypothetical protein GW891_00100 [bacterium]|nr:hypothetical protein [bacterium]MCB0538687.1 hypothetical protein [Bacteroidota bacterium]MDR1987966.1 hypothetical protein [Candidatus Peribacteria bacterium]MBT3729294.1 hypothetical protein [bacterium]MBT3853370.1 hypothetical protein [bacterium]
MCRICFREKANA